MSDYIEREKVLRFQDELEPYICRSIGQDSVELFTATRDSSLVNYIQSIPAADVRAVRRGRWIMNDESKTVCSLCGNVVAFVSHPDKRWDFGYYCPNCGADMRGGEDDGQV